MLDGKAISKIGFDYIIELVKIRSFYGKQLLKNNINLSIDSFNQTETSLNEVYDNIDTFIQLSNQVNLSGLRDVFDKVKDISTHIEAIELGQVLDTVALYEIKMQMIQFERVIDLLNQHLPKSLKLLDVNKVIKILNPDDLISDDFYIYNDYSIILKEIRSFKSQYEAEYFKAQSSDEKQIIREKRAKVVLEEANAEFDIRKKLTRNISEHLTVLKTNIINIAEIDLLFAKAHFATKYNAVRPSFGSAIKLTNARNPYLVNLLNSIDEDYQPISVELSKGTTVITGANMGGKSSSVRTIMLNVLLAHLGFYVFCEEATIAIVDSLDLVWSEDDNSLHGLSTFGVEVIKLNSTIEKLKSDKTHLIMIDEFARSTNPNEGMKFVKTLASFANNHHSFTVLTTHFDDIPTKEMRHYQVKGFVGKDIKFDKNQFKKQISKYMDYSLIEVDYSKDVPKDALNIARLLDLDEDFERDLISLYKEEINE